MNNKVSLKASENNSVGFKIKTNVKAGGNGGQHH